MEEEKLKIETISKNNARQFLVNYYNLKSEELMKMNEKEISARIAYCGLVCELCSPDHSCNCKTDNHCGKRLSPQGCYQYNCCREKGFEGCWECENSPCGIDMLSKEKLKIRAFVRCIKEDGLEAFSQYINKNAQNCIVYHRSGVFGDYDLDSEEKILNLLRTGNI
jgi:hypothetical protein